MLRLGKHFKLFFEDEILSWETPRLANDWVRETLFLETPFYMKMVAHLIFFLMGIAATTEIFTSFSLSKILIGSVLGVFLAFVVFWANYFESRKKIRVVISPSAVYLGNHRVEYDKLDRFNIFSVDFRNEMVDILAINGKKDGSTIIAGVGEDVNRKVLVEALSKRLSLDESIQIKEQS